MEKIIVRNDSKLPMSEVLTYVKQVVEMGRISNSGENYCYATVFKSGLVVEVRRNQESDTFTVYSSERAKQAFLEERDAVHAE